MSILEQLKMNERDLIVPLPFRVGLWVSQSDRTGGEAADVAEMTALSNILDGFTTEIFGSEDVQYIMAATVKERQKWPDWQKSLQNVPDECMQAVDILSLHCDPKELSAFKHRLHEIGEAVALAFCEVPDDPPEPGVIASLMEKLGFAQKHDTASLNISPKEREALNMLKAALDL